MNGLKLLNYLLLCRFFVEIYNEEINMSMIILVFTSIAYVRERRTLKKVYVAFINYRLNWYAECFNLSIECGV